MYRVKLMGSTQHFLSCDWGTTNFRLRLIERESLKIIKEHKSDHGIKSLYALAQKSGTTQFDYFSEFITNQLNLFFADHHDIPFVCSGMLSSTLGIMELPYARMPFEASGKDLVSEKVTLNTGRELLLVSGVRSELGFMRGEETQALGLSEKLTYDGVLILPGTHSKHITFVNHQFTGLKNYMTGELFDVLANRSILASSVSIGNWNETYEQSFMDGVELGLDGGIGANLLAVRAKHMFDKQSKEEGYFLLSGLLIGDEISYLANHVGHVYLAAADVTFPLYKLALESLVSAKNITLFDKVALHAALFTGQRKILENNGW